MHATAWVNGDLVPLERAVVHVLDPGFRTGEGVFETMRAYGGHTFRLEDHLARATAGAARLGLPVPPAHHLAQAVRATVAANQQVAPDLAIRLTITPGPLDPHSPWPLTPLGHPTVVVTAHALSVPPATYQDGVHAITVPWTRELADVKSVSHLAASMARRRARASGADEALLTDHDGQVLEGAGSNVFAVTDGAILTPPANAGLLAGVTRATILELASHIGAPIAEEPLPLATLLAADEAFLTASTREVVPLVRVDDARIGPGHPGPITVEVLAAYRRAVEEERGRSQS